MKKSVEVIKRGDRRIPALAKHIAVTVSDRDIPRGINHVERVGGDKRCCQATASADQPHSSRQKRLHRGENRRVGGDFGDDGKFSD